MRLYSASVAVVIAALLGADDIDVATGRPDAVAGSAAADACGAKALRRACELLGVSDRAVIESALSDLDARAHQHKGSNNLLELAAAAQRCGLVASGWRGAIDSLPALLARGPAIVDVTGHRHFCLATGIDDRFVTVFDARLAFPQTRLSLEAFRAQWNDRLLLLERAGSGAGNAVAGVSPLNHDELATIYGGDNCPGKTGGINPGPASQTGANLGTSTSDPVHMSTQEQYLIERDISIPTRGLPLEFTRYYSAQTTSEVQDWGGQSGSGTWVVENGEYSGQVGRTLNAAGLPADCTIEATLRTVEAGSQSFNVAWIDFRYTTDDLDPSLTKSGYYFLIHQGGTVELGRWDDGVASTLATAASSFDPSLAHHVLIDAQGDHITIAVDQIPEIDFIDPNPILTAGATGLEANGCHAHFDNVRLASATDERRYDFTDDDNNFVLGHGWSHTYSRRVHEYFDHVAVFGPNNSRVHYKLGSDGAFHPIDETFETLTKTTTGGFTLRDRRGTTFTFDTDGKLLTEEDRNGNQTVLKYKTVRGAPQLQQVVEPGGRALTFHWNGNGTLAGVEDPAGGRLLFGNDGIHLTSVTNRTGQTTLYDYFPLTHNLRQITDTEGNTWKYEYSIDDRISRQTDPFGKVTTFDRIGQVLNITNQRGETYQYLFNVCCGALVGEIDRTGATTTYVVDEVGNPTSRTDAAGRLTEWHYDARGNVDQSRDPLLRETATTWNEFGSPLAFTDEVGRVTSYVYDAAGNLLSRTDALGNALSFTYDPVGHQLASRADERGNVTQYQRDAFGNLVAVIDALGNVAHNDYDSLGRLIRVTDSIGVVAQYAYDAEGRLLQRTDGLGHSTSWTYTPNGLVASKTDADGHAMRWNYDAFGNVTNMTDALGNTTSYTYDTANMLHLGRANRTMMTDAKGDVTRFQYDAADRLTAIVDAAGNSRRFTRDAVGNPVSRTDALGRITAYTYDGVDRKVTTTYPDGTGIGFDYDRAGDLVRLRDATGTTTFAYDAHHRLTSKAHPGGTLQYAYDASGNRTELELVGLGKTRYSYDALNRTSAIKDAGGRIFSYAYDARSRKTQLAQPNGVTTAYAYDIADRLLQGTVAKGSQLLLDWTRAYEDDDQCRSTRRSYYAPGGPFVVDLQYAYDAAHELTDETGTLFGQPTTTRFAYDAVGNRTGRLANGVATHYLVDSTNELTREDVGPINYSYDADGNRAQRNGETYGYDFEDRLTSYSAIGITAGWTYNGLGERVAKSVNGVTTKYFYDGPELALEVTGSNPTIHLHGPGIDALLASYVSGAPPQYYHQDALGSVIATSDTAGKLTAGFDYDAFGALRFQSSAATAFGFTGRPFDVETGLLFLRRRNYDPRAGRFLTRDPIGDAGGVNLYAYVLNDPVNARDPFGRKPSDVKKSSIWDNILDKLNKLRADDSFDPSSQSSVSVRG